MKGIREYVSVLEEAMINVFTGYGIPATRIKGRSGVWVLGTNGAQDRKLGGIGIRVDHGVTMHGFAFNCSNDLSLRTNHPLWNHRRRGHKPQPRNWNYHRSSRCH